MRVLFLVALFCAAAAPAYANGCYEDFIGERFRIDLAEEGCLKNKKWNCQQFCFTYAGMTSETDFSVVMPRNQGGMNIFIPFEPGKGSEFTIRSYRWKIEDVNRNTLELIYLGERDPE